MAFKTFTNAEQRLRDVAGSAFSHKVITLEEYHRYLDQCEGLCGKLDEAFIEKRIDWLEDRILESS